MVLQQTLSRNIRADVWMDIAQLVSGLSLLAFLWIHLLAVSSIVLGLEVFMAVGLFIEKFYLLELAGISIPIFIILHLVSAGRKIPVRFRDQRVVWRVAFQTKHRDSQTWIWQVISGMSILVLVMVHIVVVTFAQGVIHADANGQAQVHSLERMGQWGWLVFYAVLLVLGETHASVGLYRQFVKWGYVKRSRAKLIEVIVTVFFVSLGTAALVAFAITANNTTTFDLCDPNLWIPDFLMPHEVQCN